MHRLFFLLILIANSVVAGPIRDGAWNDKPLDPQELLARVAKHDPAALAEWAYCSYYTLCEVPYDEALILERSRLASQRDELLGHFMLGHCLLQTGATAEERKEGTAALETSLRNKHPLAFWKSSRLKTSGLHGYQKDLEEAQQLLMSALDGGAILAHQTLSHTLRDGDLGEVNLEKSCDHLRTSFDSGFSYAAASLMYIKYNPNVRAKMEHRFTAEDFRIAEERSRAFAKLGQPQLQYVYGYYLVRYGRPHEGMPFMIRATRDRRQGMNHLFLFNDMHNVREENGDIKPLETDAVAREKAIEIGIARDNLSKNQRVEYAEKILRKSRKKPHQKEEEALKILTELVKENHDQWVNASHALGHYLVALHHHGRDPGGLQHLRGMAHFERYGQTWIGAHWIGGYYARKGSRYRDLSKAFAALHYAQSVSSGPWLRTQKQWMKQVEKSITEDEKQRAATLIKKEWPQSLDHRIRAFEYLQKIGDISGGEFLFKFMATEKGKEE